ncbi:MAG: N-acetyltransferase [Thermodesulfobacteriota bacterium]|nr:N-acetyltransferase [Thermodesulfobacteriota bacterium]
MIRNARMENVKAIYALLLHFSEKGLLLGRSLSSIYDHLRDFQVFIEPKSHKVIGVCALHIVWENLAEIRSLAVADEVRIQGIGTALVTSCLAEADRLGISDVFTLTYQPVFFERLGFHLIDKKELPHKVWSDCLNCPKFPDCNEDALMWHKETLKDL